MRVIAIRREVRYAEGNPKTDAAREYLLLKIITARVVPVDFTDSYSSVICKNLWKFFLGTSD